MSEYTIMNYRIIAHPIITTQYAGWLIHTELQSNQIAFCCVDKFCRRTLRLRGNHSLLQLRCPSYDFKKIERTTRECHRRRGEISPFLSSNLAQGGKVGSSHCCCCPRHQISRFSPGQYLKKQENSLV